jgi:hypothetical protein
LIQPLFLVSVVLKNARNYPIQLHQICIGGENVGKFSREKLWFYKKKKRCKFLSYSALLSLSQCVFLASHVVLSYPEPIHNPKNKRKYGK